MNREIKLDKLKKEDIGKWVLYDGGFKKEKGRIKSWNSKFVFVVYKCDGQWDEFKNYTACATNPEDIQLLEQTNTQP